MPYGNSLFPEERSVAIDLGEIEKELEEEIRELELEKAGYEARLDEKRRLLSRLRHGAAEQPSAPAPEDPVQSSAIVNSGRVSITDLGKHHYETAGQRFKNAGQLLDHFDVPHYFSHKHPKKGDAAAREILRWTRRSPNLAATVAVVLSDGSRMGLDTAVNHIWPDG